MMNRIDEALNATPRIEFLPPDKKPQSEIDTPLFIGYGQTNSQPSTVRSMLKWLDPHTGDIILDVGSGSGWTTALLSYLVGSTGAIYAVEKVSQLVKFGENNCKKLGITNASFFEAGATYGLSDFGPYNRILVSAAAHEVPKDLLNQLKNGGRLVIPIKNSILIIDKTKNNYKTTEYPGFVFVPLL